LQNLAEPLDSNTDSSSEVESREVGEMSDSDDGSESADKVESDVERTESFSKVYGDRKAFFPDKGEVLSWRWINDRFEKAAEFGGTSGYDCKLD